MQLTVLGMHRSGTSVVARLLNMMGAYFGDESVDVWRNETNVKGHWERPELVETNNRYLRANGWDWWRTTEIDLDAATEDSSAFLENRYSKLVEKLDRSRPWFVKDPRLCLLFPTWERQLESPLVILCLRHPLEVAKSLQTRNEFPVTVGAALWEHYNCCAVEYARHLSPILVQYEDLLRSPVEQSLLLYRTLLERGVAGLREPSKSEIDGFISPKLRHERADSSDALTTRQAALYDSLRNGDFRDKLSVSAGAIEVLREFATHRNRCDLARQEFDEAQSTIKTLREQLADLRTEHEERVRGLSVSHALELSAARRSVDDEHKLRVKQLETELLRERSRVRTIAKQAKATAELSLEMTDSFLDRAALWQSRVTDGFGMILNSSTYKVGAFAARQKKRLLSQFDPHYTAQAIIDRLLNDGETVLVTTREHQAKLVRSTRALDGSLVGHLKSPKHLRSSEAEPDEVAPYLKRVMPSFRSTGMVQRLGFLAPRRHENSQRYRIFNLIAEARKRGIECFVIDERYSGSLRRLPVLDILVVFRVPFSQSVESIINRYKSGGVPVIGDVDDLVFDSALLKLSDEYKRMTGEEQASFSAWADSIRETLMMSDGVTVSTPSLRTQVEDLGLPAAVVPNSINEDQERHARQLLAKPENRASTILSYFSGTRTHQGDFEMIAPVLARIMSEHESAKLRIVGYLDLPESLVSFESRIERVAFVPYLEMLSLLKGTDVNLAPLTPNVFNDCKSELKVFEAALVEVPTVASATDSYARCIEDGKTGYLASNETDWHTKLARLVVDSSLRTSMGKAARQRIVPRFSSSSSLDDALSTYRRVLRKKEPHQVGLFNANRGQYRWSILAPAPDNDTTKNWGDFHFAESLVGALRRRGQTAVVRLLPSWQEIDNSNTDIALVLHGLSRFVPNRGIVALAWQISHPNRPSDAELDEYDHVFVASAKWASVLDDKLRSSVSVLMQATDRERFSPQPDPGLHNRILFVGNSRKQERPVVRALINTDYEPAVYGLHWEELIPSRMLRGTYIANAELARYYSSCDALLNDHWPDMREKGFLSNRLFDGTACGAPIVSDSMSEIRETFGETIWTFESPEELPLLLDEVLKSSELSRRRADEARELTVNEHTFDDRVASILKTLSVPSVE
ncbi:MAG: glycosyltransferase [Myxococcota bacterium]